MSSPCARLRPQLDAYLSGELPAADRPAFESHLQSCSACQAELAAATRLRSALQSAVRATPVPAALETRVRQGVRAARPRPRSGLYAVAAAAALIACVYLLGLLRTQRDPAQAILARNTGPMAQWFNIGLRDHLDCAVFRKYPKVPEPAWQMNDDLGPRFAPLVALVQEKLPAGFSVIQAHHCMSHGRRYTHFIVYGNGKLMSVILTPAASGDWLQSGIQQTGVDRFQIVGFQSQGQLVYVISDLDAQRNLQSALNLAPVLRQYLAAHAG